MADPPLPTTSTTDAAERPRTSLAAARVDRGGTGGGSSSVLVWIVAVALGFVVFGAVIRLDRRWSGR